MEPQSGGGSDYFLEQKKIDSCLQSLLLSVGYLHVYYLGKLYLPGKMDVMT